MRPPRQVLARACAVVLVGLAFHGGVARAWQETGPPVTLPQAGSLRLEGSARVAPGVYLRAPEGDDGALVVLEGVRDALLDLRGVELRGAPEEASPDQAGGVAVLLRGCERVTVRGGTLGGFRVGVLVERSREIVVEDLRVEGHFARRLVSTPSINDRADELSVQTDGRDWLARYGAALGVVECEGVTVRGCRARRGQNGAVLVDSRDARLFDNDFSFLSGWGVAVSGGEDVVVAHSRLDYCVRGYSDGVYADDQGSAGVLLVDTRESVVAHCSVTHGGRGVALASGGGNLVYRNDLSYAVGAGLYAEREADLAVIENTVRGGLGGGLDARACTQLTVVGNGFEDLMGSALRVASGSAALILRNLLQRSEVGLEIGGGGPLEAAWIEGNSFSGNDGDVLLLDADGLCFRDNVFPSTPRELVLSEVTNGAGKALENPALGPYLAGLGPWLPGGSIARCSLLDAERVGPPERRAAALVFEAPQVPGSLVPEPRREVGPQTILMGAYGPWDFEGGAPRPDSRAGGLLADVRWEALWFSWADGPDPRGSARNLEAWRALADEPLHRGEVGAWTSPWGDEDGARGVRGIVGTSRFGLTARTTVELAPGRYRLVVVSDDGVRVKVDGATLLEAWSWHPARRDMVELLLAGGEHTLELEYFQIDGAAALTVDLVLLRHDGRSAQAR